MKQGSDMWINTLLDSMRSSIWNMQVFQQISFQHTDLWCDCFYWSISAMSHLYECNLTCHGYNRYEYNLTPSTRSRARTHQSNGRHSFVHFLPAVEGMEQRDEFLAIHKAGAVCPLPWIPTRLTRLSVILHCHTVHSVTRSCHCVTCCCPSVTRSCHCVTRFSPTVWLGCVQRLHGGSHCCYFFILLLLLLLLLILLLPITVVSFPLTSVTFCLRLCLFTLEHTVCNIFL